MGICAKHWPEGSQKKKTTGGALVPIEPPSIFPDEPKPSLIPTPAPQARPTHRAGTEARNPDIDELTDFLDNDAIDYQYFEAHAPTLAEELGCVYFNIDSNEHTFHSNEHNGPIFDWTICITEQCVKFYKRLELVKVPYIQYNKVRFWSELTECIRYMRNFHDSDTERANRFQFLYRQIQLLNDRGAYRGTFSKEDFIVAYTIFSRSRSAYAQLLQYIRLPCVRLLQSCFTQNVHSFKRHAKLSKICTCTHTHTHILRACTHILRPLRVLQLR